MIAAMAILGAGVAKHFLSPKPLPKSGVKAGSAALERGASKDEKSAAVSGSSRGGAEVRAGEGNQGKVYTGSYALVIGNSRYSEKDAWQELPGVAQDVQKVKGQLEASGFQVTLLENLTGRQMAAEFERFVHTYGSAENQLKHGLLIYYAGHGCTLNNVYDAGERAYLVGTDAPKAEKRGEFEMESYDMSYFTNLSEQIQARHALFVFDSCFSGDFFAEAEPRSTLPAQDAMSKHVRQFITSGNKGQTVADDSEFCRQFLLALGGAADRNKDNFVTGSELGEFLKREVSQRSKQSPVYGKSRKARLAEGEFVFPLNAATSIDAPDVGVAERKPSDGEQTNSLGMLLRKVGGSSYQVEDARKFDPSIDPTSYIPSARVSLDYTFYMGASEVRWKDYLPIMEGTGKIPSGGRTADEDLPATGMSWREAVQFCQLLTKKERTSGKLDDKWEYRLPWEAEWELSVQDAQQQSVVRADDMGGAQFWKDALEHWVLRPAGLEAPNRLGFHDLNGNALEWCMDYFVAGLPQEDMKSPRGVLSGDSRTVRGRVRTIHWTQGERPMEVVSSLRLAGFRETDAMPALGFRVVKAPVDPGLKQQLDIPPYAPRFVSQYFDGTEYGKGKMGNEDEADHLRRIILEIALSRLAAAGYADEGVAAVEETGYVSKTMHTALRNFQWINVLPTTDTLNQETLRALVLDNLTPASVQMLAKAMASARGDGVPGDNVASGVPSPKPAGEEAWILNSNIQPWRPYDGGTVRAGRY